MKIIYKRLISEFVAKHPEAANKLHAWAQGLELTSARSFSELKQAYRRIDYVPKQFTVFDVGGNSYRVVTIIEYESQNVYINKVFTHAEYDKWTRANRRK